MGRKLGSRRQFYPLNGLGRRRSAHRSALVGSCIPQTLVFFPPPFPGICVRVLTSAFAGCEPLTPCDSDQYESVAPTDFADRVCTPRTPCGTTAYESDPGTATTDRTCSPLTECGPSEYAAIGPTATTNRGCTAATFGCPHGYAYTPQASHFDCIVSFVVSSQCYSFQVDAGYGETHYITACTSCLEGTTTWHGEGLYSTIHQMTECIPTTNVTSPCTENVTYYSHKFHASDTSQNVSEACRYCRICGAEYVVTAECTLYSDTVCTRPSVSVSDPPMERCNPGYYLNK